MKAWSTERLLAGGTPPGSRAHSRGRRKSTALLSIGALTLTIAIGSYSGGTPSQAASPGIVNVGQGSYTTDVVGTLPQSAQCGDIGNNPRMFVTDNAPQGPIPTNDWWSSLLFKQWNCAYSEPLNAHPAAYQPNDQGLGISYTTQATLHGNPGGIGEYQYHYNHDLIASVAGLQAPNALVDGWTDWTVSIHQAGNGKTLKSTIGHGMPFAYFQSSGGDSRVVPQSSARVWRNDNGVLGVQINGHDYVAFAPPGQNWRSQDGGFSSAAGYFSIAPLPTVPSDSDSTRQSLANTYAQVAYNKVVDTTLTYNFNEQTSQMESTYHFTTEAVQGNGSGTVIALYPHQSQNLVSSPSISQRYVSPRGPMPVITNASQFTTRDTFHGVLPELPAVATNSGSDRAHLNSLLEEVRNNPMDARGNDTYWVGKGLGRASRIAEIADQLGETAIRDKALNDIRATLTDWFTATPGKSESVFAYNSKWGTLVGFPDSYGSAAELNDHHFHYGYFIVGAATLAKFDPAWADRNAYGGMVDLLIRDANNYDRNDNRFPYLRDFDIYAGHDWAAGHGAFGSGNNQESSSEGMNFANALIQWGQATGDRAIRDAGIYIYTTQAAAIHNYWFNSSGDTFPDGYVNNTVGMVWGSGAAYATWFSGAAEMIQGINMLPITGGHLYLGYDPQYVKDNYANLVRVNGGPPTIWRDVIWSFLALGDPDEALSQLRAQPNYTVEEGESRAHTFHWIRNLAALGNVDTSVTANHPLSSTFIKNGQRTYVASNITNQAITVQFSNGTSLNVPAGKTVASGANNWSGGNANGGGIVPTTPPTTTPPTTTPPTTTPPTTTPPTTNPPTTNPPANCHAAWDSGAVYWNGDLVTYNGVNYRAHWWTQGDVPGADEWGPWRVESNCSTQPTNPPTTNPPTTNPPTTNPPTTTPPTTTPPTTAPPTTQPPASGINSSLWYRVANVNSDKCIDAADFGWDNGSTIHQWECNRTGHQWNQHWQFVPTSDGHYTVQIRHGDYRVWDVDGGTNSVDNGKRIVLWNKNGAQGASNQQWKAIQNTDGSFTFQAKHSDKCLDIDAASTANGAKVQQWTCNQTGAQKFKLELAG